MSANVNKMTPKNSTELIVYQISELKTLVVNLDNKFDSYQNKNDERVGKLETAIATQLALNDIKPKIDIQKIILAAFALISTTVALALKLAGSAK